MTTEGAKANINKIVGGKNGPRFTSAIVSAVNANPALQECSNQSILSAALLGETLKLSPSPQLGHYYMVPFNDKEKGKTAQFILGYKGYIQLALRSGQYKKLNVLAIKEGELIRYDPLNEEIEVQLINDEVVREKTPTIGYYAFFEYLNGFRKTLYWSKDRMLAHADKYSAAFSRDGGNFGRGGKFHRVSFADYEAGNYDKNDEWMYSSFWYKDFDGMAYKTMLRQLISKWGIMSIDMVTAFESDYTIEAPDGTRAYVELDDPAVAKLPEPAVEEPAVKEAPAEPQPEADPDDGGELEWD
jgi:recombination protein RecT